MQFSSFSFSLFPFFFFYVIFCPFFYNFFQVFLFSRLFLNFICELLSVKPRKLSQIDEITCRTLECVSKYHQQSAEKVWTMTLDLAALFTRQFLACAKTNLWRWWGEEFVPRNAHIDLNKWGTADGWARLLGIGTTSVEYPPHNRRLQHTLV